MILYILKRIIFLIPFIGLALVGFMAIPSRWWTTRKMSIAGLLLLLFYNLFATSRCFPQILCFLNQREGLTQNTNQVTSNNATITQLQQDVEDGITRLQKLYLPKKVKAKSPRMPWDPPTFPQPGPIVQNASTWPSATGTYAATGADAQAKYDKAKKKMGDSSSSSKISSASSRMDAIS